MGGQKISYSDTFENADFYRPSGAVRNSTVIAGNTDTPDRADSIPVGAEKNTAGSGNKTSRSIQLQERVIVGCLFSISRGLLGEIFPIYLGRNMVGSSPDCDICLKENTVSNDHAVFFVRCDDYPGQCSLSLTDYGSIHGTLVNHNDCRYETLPVKDGDVLSFGRHYKLVVKLFDVLRCGLGEDSAFEDYASGTAVPPPVPPSQHADFYAPSGQIGNDNRTVII